jgi:nicotinate (nicotinamide) nucleotide adenylyltransferase
MKLFIYGGSFNPIHEGHIAVIRYILHELADEGHCTVVPSGYREDKPELKQGCEQRVRLLFDALDDASLDPYTFINYMIKPMMPTIKMVDELTELYSSHLDFESPIIPVIVIGSDLLEQNENGKCEIEESWYKGEELLNTKDFLIFDRPSDIKKTLTFPKSYTLIDDYEKVKVSSTELRNNS